MVQIFLSHLDAAGAETRVELDRYSNDISTFYLPNNLPTNLTVEHVQTTTHTYTRLDVFGENVALIKYDFPSGTITLLTGEVELQVPSSTSTVQRSFLLRPDDQFLTSAGRWQINWDYPDETSHSMRPPLLFLVPDTSDQRMEEIVTKSAIENLVDREEVEQDFEADTDGDTSADEVVLPQPSDTSAQGFPEHRASPSSMSYGESIASSVDDNQDVRSLPACDSASEAGLATRQSAISNDPETLEVPRDNSIHTQAESADSNVTEVPETIRHNNTELITPPPNEMAHDHTEANQIPSIESAESDATASVSEEDPITRQKSSLRKKRSLLDIEADGGAALKRPRTHTLEFESTDEDKDTVVLVPRVDIPAPSKVKKKKTTYRSKAKSAVKPTKTKRRPSIGQTAQEDQPRLDATTPPPRSSTRLAFTPSSTPKPSLTKSTLGRSLNPVIVFSSGSEIQHDKKVMNSFQKLGGIVTDKISQANTLCIGDGPLRKTAKLVMAVATGKDIVTDKWLLEAHMQQKLPNPQDFIPQDHNHEKEWKFKLNDAIGRGRQGLDLLRGYDIHLTHRIQVDLGNLKTEVKQVAMSLGANKVAYGVPARRMPGKNILIIGSPSLDEQGGKVSKLKAKMYNKDLLLLGALRGLLDLESDEFIIEIPVKEET